MTTTATWRDWSCSVRVTHSGDDADRAEGIVRSLMADVAHSASRFQASSEIEQVNARGGALVPVGRLTLQLVEVALDAARRSDGAVDPTVGAHLLAAGYTDDIEVVRSAPAVGTPTPTRRADWTSVRIDHTLGRVGVPAGLRLDLGATAKAWAADESARRVRARLGGAALVEIGGDLAVAGAPSPPWRIDVAEVQGGTAHRVDLTHGGLATSSTIGRRWSSARGPEHHVIDPRTSLPTAGPVRTATVWAPSAVEANTWSTAALVWGEQAADRLRSAGVSARLVLDNGLVRPIGDWPHDEIGDVA